MVLALFLTSCITSESDDSASQSSDELIEESITLLNEEISVENIETAQSNFEEILESDPENITANFYLVAFSITDILLDDSMEDFISEFDFESEDLFSSSAAIVSPMNKVISPSFLITNALSFATVSEEAIDISEDVETIIENVILPAMEDLLGYLDTLLGIEDMSLSLESLTGEDIEIDHSDLYFLKSIFSFLKASLHISVAYDTTTLSPGSYDTAQELIDSNPNFLTLRSTGEEHLTSAKSLLQTTLDSIESALDSLQSETDDQSNDLISSDDINSTYEEAIRETISIYDWILNDTITITISEPYYYSENITYDLDINLSNLFDNPADSIQEYLLMNGKDLEFDEVDVDYTFNGLFPNMSTFETWTTTVEDTYFTPLDYVQRGTIMSIKNSSGENIYTVEEE